MMSKTSLIEVQARLEESTIVLVRNQVVLLVSVLVIVLHYCSEFMYIAMLRLLKNFTHIHSLAIREKLDIPKFVMYVKPILRPYLISTY